MVPHSGLYILILSTVFSSLEATGDISCPCGKTGLNFTRSYGVSCTSYQFCQSCKDYSESCLSCPPDRSGRFCEKSTKLDALNAFYNSTQIRRKRSSNCRDFTSMRLVDIDCWTSRSEKECTGKCVPGYQFIGYDVNEMVLKCVNGRYTPLPEFPDCESKGFCQLKMTNAGSYNCSTGSHGTTCHILCHPNTHGTYTCIPGQPWSPPLPECITELDPSEAVTDCHCRNGGQCEPSSNRCKCPPGYGGNLCETGPPATSSRCRCSNNGRCEANGRCVCPVGYRGRYCEIVPSEGGVSCHCRNGGECDWSNDRCICKAGYSGDLCENEPSNMGSSCSCRNGGHCEHGRCVCRLGFRGRNCEIDPSDEGVSCHCKNGGKCDWSNNRCVCQPGYSGDLCEKAGGKTCKEPGDISHGWKSILTTSFTVGSVVSYSCNSGYEMSGESDLICLENGRWSAVKPTCVITEHIPETDAGGKSSCPYITPPVNSLVRLKDPAGGESAWSKELKPNANNQKFLVGSRIRYKCRSIYFEFHGSEYQTCQETGEWSGIRPTCIPECGKSEAPRTPFLANGKSTIIGQWPWQVAIYIKDVRTRRENFTCGGSLVTDKWMVTAAHCVTATRSTKNPINKRLVFAYTGKYYRSLSNKDEQVQRKEVHQILIHDDYDYLRFDSDIALIEFDSPVSLTARVKPICPPTASTTRENLIDGKQGIVVGWGETEKSNPTDELLEIKMPFVSHTRCEKSFRDTGRVITITDNMFCAGYDDGRSVTCIGDSGGPLMFLDETQWPNRWILEGIVSWGSENGCGQGNKYSGFTKVSQFTDWMNMFI